MHTCSNLNFVQIIMKSSWKALFILMIHTHVQDNKPLFFICMYTKMLKDCVFCIRKENNGINLKSDRHEYALVPTRACVCVCRKNVLFIFVLYMNSHHSSFCSRKMYVCFWKGEEIEGKKADSRRCDDDDDNGDEIQKCAKKNKQKHTDFVLIYNTKREILCKVMYVSIEMYSILCMYRKK